MAKEQKPTEPMLVEVKNFRKSFGTKVVHKDVSFHLAPGEIVCLLGASGSGKSVFLRALIGLETPDAGTMFYKGRSLIGLKELDWFPIRQEIAYAFQGGALFDSFTIQENLQYPLDAHTKLTKKEKKNASRRVWKSSVLPAPRIFCRRIFRAACKNAPAWLARLSSIRRSSFTMSRRRGSIRSTLKSFKTSSLT